MKRKAIFIKIIFFFLILGRAYAQSDNQFIVKGLVDTVPNARYFVSFKKGGKLFRDTISLDNNRKFTYAGEISEPTIFSLSIKNDFNKRFVGDAIVYSFWVQPGKTINFKGNRGWLIRGQKGLVTRDKEFEIYNSDIENIEKSYRAERRSKTDSSEIGRILNSEELTSTLDSIFHQFVSQKPLNYFGLYLLNQETKKNDFNAVYLKDLFEKYPKELKNTFLGADTKERINIKFRTAVGEKMNDFQQRDTSSTIVRLSDFRGKYVLVDFWASWCGPCRKESPDLVKAYRKYHAKGFEIIGVSLDNNRKSWLEAIKQDGLNWVQLSDLKSFDNAVARQFFIHAVPANFLLDPDGIIIGKDLRGKELEGTLRKLFK